LKTLLDTHVLLWWLAGDRRLSRGQRRVINRASEESPLGLSDISLWEIATLYELGRIELDRPLREWLEQASAPPLVRRVGISPAVAAEVAALPASFHRDPADRIIVATARVLGAKLLTSDRAIVDSNLVPTQS
jgi:PIN domain nuclease of toxin-antitoxin system